MARPLRLEFPGAIYHITSRGNARAPIYADDADCVAFLGVLADAVHRFGWLCHAYCLMTNHYHLLVETPDPNLSRGMRELNGLYTQGFNRRHGRVGHVLQGRFKALVVERESYLLELTRYIVLNPVRARMVAHASAYPWSSHRATAGLEASPEWLSLAWILAQFGRDLAGARERYGAFVDEGVGRVSPWPELKGQVLLGSEAFVERLQPLLAEHATVLEVPRPQRLAHRPPLERLLSAATSVTKAQRDNGIRLAFEQQYRLSEIGRQVGLHYTTVSRIVRSQDPQHKT